MSAYEETNWRSLNTQARYLKALELAVQFTLTRTGQYQFKSVNSPAKLWTVSRFPTWKCDCPDFTGTADIDLMAFQRSKEKYRDWSNSAFWIERKRSQPYCLHIMAVQISRGEIDLPSNIPTFHTPELSYEPAPCKCKGKCRECKKKAIAPTYGGSNCSEGCINTCLPTSLTPRTKRTERTARTRPTEQAKKPTSYSIAGAAVCHKEPIPITIKRLGDISYDSSIRIYSPLIGISGYVKFEANETTKELTARSPKYPGTYPINGYWNSGSTEAIATINDCDKDPTLYPPPNFPYPLPIPTYIPPFSPPLPSPGGSPPSPPSSPPSSPLPPSGNPSGNPPIPPAPPIPPNPPVPLPKPTPTPAPTPLPAPGGCNITFSVNCPNTFPVLPSCINGTIKITYLTGGSHTENLGGGYCQEVCDIATATINGNCNPICPPPPFVCPTQNLYEGYMNVPVDSQGNINRNIPPLSNYFYSGSPWSIADIFKCGDKVSVLLVNTNPKPPTPIPIGTNGLICIPALNPNQIPKCPINTSKPNPPACLPVGIKWSFELIFSGATPLASPPFSSNVLTGDFGIEPIGTVYTAGAVCGVIGIERYRNGILQGCMNDGVNFLLYANFTSELIFDTVYTPP